MLSEQFLVLVLDVLEGHVVLTLLQVDQKAHDGRVADEDLQETAVAAGVADGLVERVVGASEQAQVRQPDRLVQLVQR